eukprot:gene31422-53569_t
MARLSGATVLPLCVEDDDSMFRFNYSEDFLKLDWHVSIRSIKDPDTTIGFISGIPVNIRVGTTVVRMCEINFLCIEA